MDRTIAEKENSLQKPRVSVVIPSYKAEKTIVRAISSLLSQTRVSCEVIVVEDGVFDETSSAIASFDDIIHIQLLNNRGAQYARNLGLSKATSDYVLFLDSDDYHEGELLYGLVLAIEAGGASLAFGRQKIIDDSNANVISMFVPPKGERSISVVERWLNGNAGPNPSAILWRRKSLNGIGGWNEAYKKNQDGELVIRAMFSGLSAVQSYMGFGIYVKHNEPSISKAVTYNALMSQVQLDEYVEGEISKIFKNQNLVRALQTFRLRHAIYCYSNDDLEFGRLWEAKWSAQGRGSSKEFRKTLKMKFGATLFWLLGVGRTMRFVRFLRFR